MRSVGGALGLDVRAVPLDRHQHGDGSAVPGDHQVLALVLDLGDVIRQTRLQVARTHGVTQRLGHASSVQAGGHRDHIVWLQ